jgi:hypothetical protein
MHLDNLPFPVFGDTSFRGKCPLEGTEQASFFSRLRREYPDTWGLLALHPRNEQLLSNGQFSTVLKHKAEGMTAGAADIVIPAARSFVCEMKRLDHTQSKWQDKQQEYLTAAQACGTFACVALGAVGAWKAFETWKSSL